MRVSPFLFILEIQQMAARIHKKLSKKKKRRMAKNYFIKTKWNSNNINIIKRLTLAKILCWTFRQLLLPSSAGMKNAKI